MASPTSSSSPSNNALLSGWDRALDRARGGPTGGARIAVSATAEASLKPGAPPSSPTPSAYSGVSLLKPGTPPPSPTSGVSLGSYDRPDTPPLSPRAEMMERLARHAQELAGGLRWNSELGAYVEEEYDRPDTPLSPGAELMGRLARDTRELAGGLRWNSELGAYVEEETDGRAAAAPAAAKGPSVIGATPDVKVVGGGAAAAAAVETSEMMGVLHTFAASLPVVNSVVSFFGFGSSAPAVTPPKAEEFKAAAGGAGAAAAIESPCVLEADVGFSAGLPVVNSVIPFLGLGSSAPASASLSTPTGTPPLSDAQRVFLEGLQKLQAEYPHGIPRVLYDPLVLDLRRAETKT